MSGLKVVITAGPTREYLDPVRFLSNASSGLTGYNLAQSFARHGFKVTLISGPTNLKPPRNVRFVRVTSAREMFKTVWNMKKICDIFIGAAAVSDWRPERRLNQKIKKGALPRPVSVRFVPNPDIIGELAKWRRNNNKAKLKTIAGFALETENILKNARKKLETKDLDIIVANRSQNMGKEEGQAVIIKRSGEIYKLRQMPKKKLAECIYKAMVSYC